MTKWTLATLAVSASLLVTANAQAQMTNRPASFDGSGRTGMSIAGRQAIIQQELFGATPNVLLKRDDGRLLGLLHGPGSTAIVTSPSGEILPSHRGRRTNRDLRAEEFNGFFVNSRTSTTRPYDTAPTGETIAKWTATVISGHPIGGYSSVDQWTSMTYLLER